MARQQRRDGDRDGQTPSAQRGLGRLFGRGRRKDALPKIEVGERLDGTDGPSDGAGVVTGQPEPVQPDDRGERIEIPHSDGSTLRALLVAPEGPVSDVPGFLWIHGDDPSDASSAPAEPAMARLMSDHRPCVVLCLDHPANVRDCHLALVWLRDHARARGIAPDQLMVGGEGMGANLAIQLACYERDQGLVSVAWQLPLYPSLSADWRDGLPGVARHFGYRGLPPTTTIVGMDDFSRDATIAFVEAMRKDGADVDFHMYRGHFSGTGMWDDTPGIREAKSFILRQFDEAIASYRAPQPSLRSLDLPSIG